MRVQSVGNHLLGEISSHNMRFCIGLQEKSHIHVQCAGNHLPVEDTSQNIARCTQKTCLSHDKIDLKTHNLLHMHFRFTNLLYISCYCKRISSAKVDHIIDVIM